MDIDTTHIILFVSVLAFIAVVYKLMMGRGPKRMQIRLGDKKQVTHDSIIFTFVLPDQSKPLGLKIGEHIQIEQPIKGQLTKRKYTPISEIDQIGSFELLLKIYHPDDKFPNGGIMSMYLEALDLNQKITITFPYGRFNYLGNSVAQIRNLDNSVIRRKFEKFYMVAGGTGITPIYQIIQYTCEKQKREAMPELTLLFANRTEQDILLEQSLRSYASENPKFKLHFSVDRQITDSWAGLVGFVNEEKVASTMPGDVKDTLFMSCGPPILSNIVEKIWISKGVPGQQIFRF